MCKAGSHAAHDLCAGSLFAARPSLLAAERFVQRKTSDALYHGTRVSGTGAFVVVAANDEERFPLHVIDAADRSIQPIAHGGTGSRPIGQTIATPCWPPSSTKPANNPATGALRLMSWSVSAVAEN